MLELTEQAASGRYTGLPETGQWWSPLERTQRTES